MVNICIVYGAYLVLLAKLCEYRKAALKALRSVFINKLLFILKGIEQLYAYTFICHDLSTYESLN